MERKIFTTDESRIRSDLESNLCCIWLRSADPDYSYSVDYVNYYGTININSAHRDYGVLPTGTI